MSNDSNSLQRYGYISQGNIPYLSNPNIKRTGKDRPGVLKVLGELGLSFVATAVAGSMLRAGTAKMMLKAAASENNAAWLRALGKEFVEVSGKLDNIEGIVKNPRTGEVVSSLNMYAKTKLNPRGAAGQARGFTKYLPDAEYNKAFLASRVTNVARRIPYELPGYYVSSRLVLEREQYEKDIREGKFNPKNPLDVIGDFAKKSVGFVVADTVLSVVGPYAKDVARTTMKFADSVPTDKLASSLSKFGKVNQIALGENLRSLSKFTEKQLVKAQSISDIFEEAKDRQWIKFLTTRTPGDVAEDVTLGPFKVGTTSRVKSEFKYLGSLYTDRMKSYNQYGPGGAFLDRRGRIKPVLGLEYGKVQQELSMLASWGDTRSKSDPTKYNFSNEYLTGNIQARVMELSRQDMFNNPAISRNIGRKKLTTVTTEAVNIVSQEFIQSKAMARVATGSYGPAAGQSMDDFVKATVFKGYGVGAELEKRLPGKTTVLQSRLSSVFGIDISETEAKAFMEDAFTRVRTRTSSLASNSGNYSIYTGEGIITRNVAQEAERKITEDIRESAAKYIQGAQFKKLILNKSSESDIATAALGLYSTNVSGLVGEGNPVDIWRRSIGASSQDDAMEFARNLLKFKNRAADTYGQSFNILGLRRMSIEESVGYQRQYYKNISAAEEANRTGIPTSLNRQNRYTRRGPLDTAISNLYGKDEIFKKGTGEGYGALLRAGGSPVRNITADAGLYTTMTGKVVDARPLMDAGIKALSWAEKNMQIPLVGFNPLSMSGYSTWIKSITSPRIRVSGPGAGRAMWMESILTKDPHNYGDPSALFSPMPIVRGEAIGYNWMNRKAYSAGQMTTIYNEGSMGQKLARLLYGEKRIPEWEETKRNLQRIKLPGSDKGFGFNSSGRLAYGDKTLIDFDFDISPDTSNSVFHKLTGWINKQAFHTRNIRGRLAGEAAEQRENYGPNYLRMLRENNVTIDYDNKEAVKRIEEARNILSGVYDSRAVGIFEDALGDTSLTRNAQFGGDVGTTLRGVVKNARENLDDLRRIGRETPEQIAPQFRDETQKFQLNIDKTIQSRIDDLEQMSAEIAGRSATRPEVIRAKQVASDIQLMISLAKGDTSYFNAIEAQAQALYDTGEIGIKTYRAVKAQLASTKMYTTKMYTKEGISASSISDVLERSEDALNYVLGPRGGARIPAGGGRLRQAFNLYESTYGNDMYRDPSAGILQSGGKISNIFGNTNWIAIRPFSRKMGIRAGLDDLTSRLGGGWGAKLDDDISPLGTAKGVFTGPRAGGELTTGGLYGWHAVSRVLDVFGLGGFGLSPDKYSSAADYLIRGGLGKRVIPLVGAGLAIGTMQGMPGLGVNGIGGLAATAFGPGLGMTRAGVGEALNAIPGAFPGSQKFWSTYATVTGAKEDESAYKYARTPQEEEAYWRRGDDPVRQGRYWMLSMSPWKGNRISFYEPNWYRQYMSQYEYTDDFKGSHLEWAMYGTDLSPGKYLDPYHYENKTKDIRPYPITGEMFTGPWGPVTPFLNATVGQILKPQREMHNSPEDMAARQAIAMYTSIDEPGVVQLFTSGMMKQGKLMSYPGGGGGVDTGGPYGYAMVGKATKGSPGGLINISNQRNADAMSRSYRLGSPSTSGSGGGGGPVSNGVAVNINRNIFVPGGAREQFFRYRPDVSMAGRNGLGYSAGELAYMSSEFAGIYGFMSNIGADSLGFNADYAPSGPMLESADKMYGMARSFWDLNLGGLGDMPMGKSGNLEFSEIARRFIPKRRKNIDYINNIPNQMPDWMPGPGSLMDFRTGDPYTKVPKGEARLPGEGYKRLNQLNPDEYGEYGAIDRFKILANVSPWSDEYRYWQKILDQDLTKTPEEQAIVTEAKRQAAQRKKKLNLRKRIWSGNITKYEDTPLSMSTLDPNIFTTESGESVRLAGVRFSKSPEGLMQARKFYQDYLQGKRVELYKDSEMDSPLNNREKTTDIIAKVNGLNINEQLLSGIRRGDILGSESRANNYIDMSLRVGGGWAAFGKLEEAVTHADVPFLKAKFGKYDAQEWLEQKMVYGKQWTPWQTPIQSFLEPEFQSYTKPDGIWGVMRSAILTGGLASMFFRGGAPSAIAGTIGAGVGLLTNGATNIESALTGQRWIPDRRKKEFEVEEYMDVLKYVKYSNLYEQSRQRAIEKEGIDINQLYDELGNIRESVRTKFTSKWDTAEPGGKPAKAISKKIMEAVGPAAREAMMYKQKMEGTMYGAPLGGGDYMAIQSAIPERYRPIYQDLLETPVSKRQDVLQLMPRLMRRILQTQWRLPVEKKPGLDSYFQSHSLPGKGWEGWLPQVNLDEVTIKVMKNEAIDTSEFGYFPNEVQNAENMPWSAPAPHMADGRSTNDIMTQLSSMGLTNVRMRETSTPGIHLNLLMDLRQELTKELGVGA
jgi:hypothetical protein